MLQSLPINVYKEDNYKHFYSQKLLEAELLELHSRSEECVLAVRV